MPYEVSGFCPLSGQFAPNHEQHSYWQQIKPLHKRTFAHHFCKFGTGEDRQIEDAVSSCNPCERGYFVLLPVRSFSGWFERFSSQALIEGR